MSYHASVIKTIPRITNLDSHSRQLCQKTMVAVVQCQNAIIHLFLIHYA